MILAHSLNFLDCFSCLLDSSVDKTGKEGGKSSDVTFGRAETTEREGGLRSGGTAAEERERGLCSASPTTPARKASRSSFPSLKLLFIL